MHFVGKSGQKSTRKCASTQLTPSLKRSATDRDFEELDLHSLVVTSVSQARHVQLGEQLVKAKGVLVEAFGGSQLRLFACRDTLESFDA